MCEAAGMMFSTSMFEVMVSENNGILPLWMKGGGSVQGREESQGTLSVHVGLCSHHQMENHPFMAFMVLVFHTHSATSLHYFLLKNPCVSVLSLLFISQAPTATPCPSSKQGTLIGAASATPFTESGPGAAVNPCD